MSMGSSYRDKNCLYLSRSWELGCSCFRYPRLLLVLSTVYLLLNNSQSQARYYDHDTGTSYTFTCVNKTWCGENWAPNRILRYHYNLTDKLVQITTQTVIHENNCSGVQDSQDCSSQTIVHNITRPMRIKTLKRSTHPEITTMPILDLYLITTDNINDSSSISDTYPLNQDKIWQLHIPATCKMTVYFSQFDLEVSDMCERDSFSVQIKKDQRDAYRYCNDLHRIEIKRRKRVQMTFHSDSAVRRNGIKAVVCLSDLHDASSETELDQRFPCTCNRNSGSTRRKKASLLSNRSLLKQKIAEEESKVTDWLHTMMQGGHSTVDSILRESENPKQRHLAEQFQTVLSKHREW